MRRKTSSIWYHFNQKDDDLGECKYCKALLSFAGGSINNLKRHLRNKHITVAIKSNFASARDCQDDSNNLKRPAAGSRQKHLKKKHTNLALESDVESVCSEEESSLPSTHTDYHEHSNDSLSTLEDSIKHNLIEQPKIVVFEKDVELVGSSEDHSLATTQKNCQDDSNTLLNIAENSVKKQSTEKQPKETFESNVEAVASEEELSSATTQKNCQDDSNALLSTPQQIMKKQMTEADKSNVESVASRGELPSTQTDSQDCSNALLRMSGGFMKKRLKKNSSTIAFKSNLASVTSQNESGLSKPSTSRRSRLWNHFNKTKDGKGECKCCKAKVSIRGSISNLKRHLQKKHPVIAVENNFGLGTSGSKSNLSTSTPKTSPLWSHFNKKEDGKGECKYCHASLSIAGGSISNLKSHLKKKHPTVAIESKVDSAVSKEESCLSPTQTDCQEDDSLLNTVEGSMKKRLKKEHTVVTDESDVESVPSKEENVLSKPPTSRRSRLWNHFIKTKDAKGKCKYCKAKVSIRGSISNLKRHLQKKHPIIAVENNFLSVTSKSKSSKISPLWYHFNKKNDGKGKCKYCYASLSIAGGSISNLKRHLMKKHPTVTVESKVESGASKVESCLSPSQTDCQEDNSALLKAAEMEKHTIVTDESDVESVPSEEETDLSSTQTDFQEDISALLNTAEGSTKKCLKKKHTIVADESNVGQTIIAVEIVGESTAALEESCLPITKTDCQDNSNAIPSTMEDSLKKSLIEKQTIEPDENDIEPVTSRVELHLPTTQTESPVYIKVSLSTDEDSLGKCLIKGHPSEAVESDVESVASEDEPCSPRTPVSSKSLVWCHFNKKEGGRVECKYCCALLRGSNMTLKRHLQREHLTIAVESNLAVESCISTSCSRSSPLWYHFNKKGVGKCECKYCFALLSISGASISNLRRHLQRKHPTISIISNENSAASGIESGLPTSQTDSQDNSNALVSSDGVFTKKNQTVDSKVESRLPATSSSKRSLIWHHFNKEEDNKGECKYCHALISTAGGSISNLKRHLQKKHLAIAVKNNYASMTPANESVLPTPSIYRPNSLWDHFNKKENDKGECKYCYALLSIAGDSIGNLRRHLHKNHPTVAVESNMDSAPSANELNSSTVNTSRGSFVWRHFIRKEEGYGECNYCNAWLSFAGGSTSNLKRHLQKKHPTVLLEENEELITIERTWSLVGSPGCEIELDDDNISVSHHEIEFATHQTGISNSEISHSQTMLENSLQTAKPPIVEKDNKFNLQLLKMICKEFNSFCLVEDPEFRKFVSLLCPGYQLPNRKTLSQAILPQVYEELVVKIKQQLSNATAVALTTQGWTSVYDQCYIVITAHYFNESTTLCSSLLGSIEYNQQNFPEMLTKFCKDWEIHFKISAIVTDNNSDIVSAIKQCQWKHISCYANSIHSVLKSGVKPADQIIKKIKSLVQHFKKNPDAVSTLHDVQKQMGLPPMKFKQDVSTRWVSTYDTLSNVFSNRTMIMSTLAVLGNFNVDISPDEWDVCQHLIMLLEIFEEVSNEINSDKSVSLSETVMINMNLLDFFVNYKRNPNLPDFVIELCNNFEEEINKILCQADDNVELKFEAALLDPRFKQNAFEENKARFNQVYESLITQIQMLIISEPDLSTSPKFGSLWSEFDNEVAAFNRSCKPRSSSIIELENYLAESILPRIYDPMAWWEERKLAYPNLYKIVLKKLCIPASLVPSKRMFSNSSHILKEKQSGLGSSKVNKIVFLNCNL